MFCQQEIPGLKTQTRSVSVLVTQNYVCVTSGVRNTAKDILLLSQLDAKPKAKVNNVLTLIGQKKIHVSLTNSFYIKPFVINIIHS